MPEISNRLQQIPADPAFFAPHVPAPVPAVDLAQRFKAVAALDGEHGGIVGFEGGVTAFAERFQDFLGDVAVVAIVVGRPDPAGPRAVGDAGGDLVSGFQVDGVAILVLVVGVRGEDGHGCHRENQTGQKPNPLPVTSVANANANANANEISFMIFRTGSVLIVGRCGENVLFSIYNFLKKLLEVEYPEIGNELNILQPKKHNTKLRKKTINVLEE